MLTADLVHARRQKGELKVTPLSPARRARALELARAYREIAEAHLGESRDVLESAFGAIDVEPRERKLADGLRKLTEDGLELESELDLEPIALRRRVFELATDRRKELAGHERFDREALLDEVAAELEVSREALERGLYGDLKSAQVLKAISLPPPEALVERYDLEQIRAVLLRAVRVTARIRGAGPLELRALFHKLKFLRLLHEGHREADGALRLEIDGPFSLFESVTKYGLALAIALPAITACGRFEIEAELRWGKARDPLRFRFEGEREGGSEAAPRLVEEVEALRERFAARKKSPWSVAVAEEVVDLPGVGLIVPDLVFTHTADGSRVLLEVLGFWSREAVFRRIELAERGLPVPVLFAASRRLRVSEALLDDVDSASLYVYKGALSPKQIEAHLDALSTREG